MMITPDGARKQQSLQTHPATRVVQSCHDLLLGMIQKNGVFHTDNGQNPSGSTLVNISLMHGWPDIYRVPILSPKINRSNGMSMDPEPGDQVVVAFLNGSFCHPVVVGFLPPPSNNLQPASADAPLHHTRWQGSDIKLEKDGTRRVYLAANDVLEVVGNGTVTIHGNLTVQIDGTANVTVNGNATLKAAQVTFDTANANSTGNISDSLRSMAADRVIYNGHTHNDPQGGATGTPNQQM